MPCMYSAPARIPLTTESSSENMYKCYIIDNLVQNVKLTAIFIKTPLCKFSIQRDGFML